MKKILILSLLASYSVFAAQKKAPSSDLREGTKAVDEKYLKVFSGENLESKPTTQSRVHQMESKKSRQFQEENPRSQSSQ